MYAKSITHLSVEREEGLAFNVIRIAAESDVDIVIANKLDCRMCG